ncbi:excisionase family DNA-binding protein [Lentzea californiensis]|uniref:excisionase family DNA-binding protein n=1 Tax=Lentzea californiensis TaxID=438851 RepID=UPI0021640D0E|nr:excisionase family DNA-binding protein [Lentzea californiensis]MCR3746668.1 DNA binding domain-containing protein, excisionase family [Lentzea californiensis]
MAWERQTLRAAEIQALLGRLAELLTTSPDVDPPEVPAQRAVPEPKLLTVEEAAKRLGVSRTRMYALIGSGEVESVQIGRLRRVHVDQVDAYATHLVRIQNAA